MNTNLVSIEDMEYLAGQSAQNMNMILSGMTMLMDENSEKTAMLESQIWFQRMSSTITGKNKMTLAEIQQNHDKINMYMSQAMSELFERNCIDQQIMMGLGMRLNDLYAEHLQLKQMLGAFADKLNQKIISIDNFHMLETEIEQGVYSNAVPLAAMCRVLSQLDTRTLGDSRKLDIIERSMREKGIISGAPVTISEYLTQLLNTDDREIGIIYMELGILGDNFIAGIFRNAIENYHFLPKTARMMKKKELVAESVVQQNQLDASAELSLEDIYREFLDGMIIKVPRIGILGETAVGIESFDEELQNAVTDFLKYPTEETLYYLVTLDSEDGFVQYLAAIGFNFIPQIKNSESANDCLEKGYVAGNPLAAIRYAKICNDTDKAEKIICDNVEQLKRLAMQGNAFAMYEYAVLCSESSKFNVREEGFDVRDMLGKAADQGYWLAKFQLARRYRYGIDGESDYEKAYRLFAELDKLGMPQATHELAHFYLNGYFVEMNESKAAKLYEKAAKSGHVAAQYKLAQCYRYGWGVFTDLEKAEEWYGQCLENSTEFMNILKDIMDANYDLNDRFIIRRDSIAGDASYALFEIRMDKYEIDTTTACSNLMSAARFGNAKALYKYAECAAGEDEMLEDYISYNLELAKYCLEKAKKFTDDEDLLASIDWLELKIELNETKEFFADIKDTFANL